MVELYKGKTLRLENGHYISITSDGPFKEGGQGNLYLISYGGNTYVLKWYHSESILKNSKKFIDNLTKLTKMSINNFVLPYMITEEIDGQFGYIMDYISRENDYVPLTEYLFEETQFKSRKAREKIPYLIAECYADLHKQGLSFMDINYNNIFINLKRPMVKICDCDNIDESGNVPFVRGKMGSIAPEIVKGENHPDIYSDEFSLAIILYHILVGGDPFIGKHVPAAPNEAEIESAYGNPIFVMGDNKINELDDEDKEEKNDKWNKLTPEIRSAFKNTLEYGVKDKEKRTTSEVWMKLLETWSPNLPEKSINEQEDVKNLAICKKRYQPVFFIIDCSNSMNKYNRLVKVNEALNEYIKEVKNFNDVDFSINILCFSNNAEWTFDESKNAQNIDCVNLSTTGTFTNFNRACKSLDNYLKKEVVLNNEKHTNPPIIMLFSDGLVTRPDYEDDFNILRKNKWYGKAFKVAIAIDVCGPTESMDMLMDFVGNVPECVKSLSSETKLAKLIKNITMSISQSVSQNDWKQLRERMLEMK